MSKADFHLYRLYSWFSCLRQLNCLCQICAINRARVCCIFSSHVTTHPANCVYMYLSIAVSGLVIPLKNFMTYASVDT